MLNIYYIQVLRKFCDYQPNGSQPKKTMDTPLPLRLPPHVGKMSLKTIAPLSFLIQVHAPKFGRLSFGSVVFVKMSQHA